MGLFKKIKKGVGKVFGGAKKALGGITKLGKGLLGKLCTSKLGKLAGIGLGIIGGSSLGSSLFGSSFGSSLLGGIDAQAKNTVSPLLDHLMKTTPVGGSFGSYNPLGGTLSSLSLGNTGGLLKI